MSDESFRLILVDSDRIFRMGMRAWLDQFPDLQVVAEFDAAATALLFLESQIAERSPDINPRINLVITDLLLKPANNSTTQNLTGLDFCQQLRQLYPDLAIFALSSPQSPKVITAALKAGVHGYCLKGTIADELLTAIREVARGNLYLSNYSGDRYPEPSPRLTANLPNQTVRVVDVIKHNFYISGIQRIDQQLQNVRASLENPQMLGRLNQVVLEGQARELRAARWLIGQMWGDRRVDIGANSSDYVGSEISNRQPTASITTVATNTNVLSIQASLWDREIAKIQNNLANFSKTPLEIDILKEEKKRELLYIALRQIEQSLTDLRFSQIQPSQLEARISEVLRYIWRATIVDFFGKYYFVRDRDNLQINVMEVLLKDEAIAKIEFLDKIPQVYELFSHLLFGTEIAVSNSRVAIGSVEAMQRGEIILDNLIVQIANAVIQPLLNNFGDFEEIKQSFYRYNLMATREIEKFRNNLSWKYRLEKYVIEPKLIFESRHVLFCLTDSGIKQTSIYVPRTQELQQLEGVQLTVTLALELQDAIAPRLKSAIALIGSGFVYVLTNVIGRGLGLIGRGVLQGIGNAWQDSRK
ncbi:MAG: hypothetical protein AUK48_14735 [Oscillatoriales cyanobacterium CG2_30_44_21]|nr:MAG: hypothetical protein AUK48_14735 [Oscillatoriales cyanobacterium CG2_30_44_21]